VEEYSFWEEILRRMDRGESQASIAQSLGWTRGRLRYRLQKFQESQRQGKREMAAAMNEKSHVPHRLEKLKIWMDESWSREGIADRLVLMTKDPWTVFAYWTVSASRKEMVQEHFETGWDQLPWMLRLSDVTDMEYDGYCAHKQTIVSIHPRDDHWYFRGIHSGRRYIAELGTRTIRDDLFVLLRSNVAATPPVAEEQGASSRRFVPVSEPKRPAGATVRTGHPYFPSQDIPWSERFNGYSLEEREGR
jgi:uncharacterized protein